MADLTDVQSSLVSLIAQALYPNGTSQPSAVTIPVKAYAGWPAESQLDADLRAGTAHVTVFARPEERNTSRAVTDWQEISRNPETLTLTVVGQVITVGGAMPSPFAPCNVMVMANKQYFAYAVQAGDTLTTIATALATLMAVAFPGTTNTGPAITAAAGARIATTRVGTSGTMVREIGRQQKVFQITIWTDTPVHRSAVSSAVDIALRSTQRVTMADTSIAHVTYKSSNEIDGLQKAKLYKRDLMYQVEYATTDVTTGYEVTQETVSFSPALTDLTNPLATTSVNL